MRLGHDPGENDQKKEKKEGPEKNGFASEELDVFIIRPFDIHSSHPVRIDSATQCSCRISGARVSKYTNVNNRLIHFSLSRLTKSGSACVIPR